MDNRVSLPIELTSIILQFLFVKILPIYALFLNENFSKCAVSAGTLGVHPAFGDHLPIKVCEFLQEPDILEKCRSAWSSGHSVLVVDDRRPSPHGKFFLFILS